MYGCRSKDLEKLFILIFLIMAVHGAVFCQDRSIEDAYLQQAPEIMIIREQTSLNDRDSKLAALGYIRILLDSGKKNDEIRAILQDLALEGILNKLRAEGRTANNFPDIRIVAVNYLGDIQTKESHDSLLKVILAEKEPSVVTEAIHSLAKIGINDNDKTIDAILTAFTGFDARKPDNVLALSVLDALDYFTRNTGSKNPAVYRTLLYVSQNAGYTRPVRRYSAKLLSNLYKFAGS